jgi:hypothetical protein
VKTSRSSAHGWAKPLKVSVASTMAVTNMQPLVTMRRRLRLRMSASTPPGTMSTKTASAFAALMRAIRRAEVVRLVICHWAANVCIQLPMLDVSEAMKRARKKGLASGAVTGAGRAARSARGVAAGSVEIKGECSAADGAYLPRPGGAGRRPGAGGRRPPPLLERVRGRRGVVCLAAGRTRRVGAGLL